MKIVSAEFVTSALKPQQYPPVQGAEIAFAGKSNVGKSSLMNALLNRRKLVKTSSSPGKTQMINFFSINDAFFFVDLPGYGYAKVPLSVKKEWGPMMQTYIRARPALRAVVCLIDARREFSEMDVQLFSFLEEHKKHRILVFTKIDKLKKSEQKNFHARMKSKYGLDKSDFVAVSNLTKKGIDELWELLDTYLSDLI